MKDVKMLQKDEKIDMFNAGELQTILTIVRVTDTMAYAKNSLSSYEIPLYREYSTSNIRPVNDLGTHAYSLHTGNPPDHFHQAAKEKYLQKVAILLSASI